jgi:hypothetical protein
MTSFRLSLLLLITLLTGKDAPAYVRPESQPKPPAPPRCQLTLAQAPVIRGFRLGMDVNEILALMPENDRKLRIKADLENASLTSRYGSTILSIRGNEVMPVPANLERFAGVDHFNFTVLDNRIVSIYVKHLRTKSLDQPNWNSDSSAAKIAQAFSLPDLIAWDNKYPPQLTCSGFTVSANPDEQSVVIRNNSFQSIIDQRRAAEQERL